MERNSEITGYVVTYITTSDALRPTRQASEEEVFVITGTDAESRVFTASGLLPQTNYTFTVRANNSESLLGPSATLSTNIGVPEGNLITVEPLIKDPPRKGQPLKGHSSERLSHSSSKISKEKMTISTKYLIQ